MEYQRYQLRDIGDIVSGATPKTTVAENFGGAIPWLTPADLSGYTQKYISHGARNLTKQGYDSCSAQIMPSGTVLFSSRAPIGYTAIAKNPICTNQGFKSIVPKPFVNSEFLYYQLIYLRKTIQEMGSGTTFKEISAKKFGAVQVIVPPLPEQERIVARIEKLLSQLDASVAELKMAKERLKVYRQAVLKEAFAICSETVRIRELCNVVRGGSPRPAGDERFYNGTIPFLKVADLTNIPGMYLTKFSSTIKKAGLKRTRLVSANTLLLSNSGATLGVPKICRFQTTFNDGIAAFLDLDEKREYLPYHYYFWMSQTLALRAINQGAAQPNLNTAIIGNVLIPHCSYAEQKEISQQIEARLSVCDNIEKTVDTALQQAEALRQSILKKAFEGEMV